MIEEDQPQMYLPPGSMPARGWHGRTLIARASCRAKAAAALGLAFAVAASGLIGELLYGVSAADPGVLLLVAAVLRWPATWRRCGPHGARAASIPLTALRTD